MKEKLTRLFSKYAIFYQAVNKQKIIVDFKISNRSIEHFIIQGQAKKWT